MLCVGIVLTLGVLVVACGSTPQPIPTPVPSTTSLPPTIAPSEPPTPAAQPTATAATSTPSPAPSPSPGPPTVVTSDDGLLTLAIPYGAVPDGVEITATALGESELPTELVGLEVRSGFYRVQPPGLTFQLPVGVNRRVSYDALGLDPDLDGLPILALAVRSSDARWAWLDSPELTTEGDFVSVLGEVGETGTLFAFGGTASTMAEWSSPDLNVAVGSSVTVEISLAYPANSEDPPILGDFAPIIEGELVSAVSSSTGSGGTSFSQQFRCDATGNSEVGLRYEVSNIGAEAALFNQLGLAPASTQLTIRATITCASPVPSAT